MKSALYETFNSPLISFDVDKGERVSPANISAKVFEYELFSELLCLAVAVLGSLLEALGLLQRVGSLQSPGVQSRLQGGVVENAASQQDGRTPLWRVLESGGGE